MPCRDHECVMAKFGPAAPPMTPPGRGEESRGAAPATIAPARDPRVEQRSPDRMTRSNRAGAAGQRGGAGGPGVRGEDDEAAVGTRAGGVLEPQAVAQPAREVPVQLAP